MPATYISLYVTVTLLGPVTLAETRSVALPSSTCTRRSASVPSGLGRSATVSSTAASFIVMLPAAPSATVSPPNVTTCVSVRLPDRPVTALAPPPRSSRTLSARAAPPRSSSTPAYADRGALAGSL